MTADAAQPVHFSPTEAAFAGFGLIRREPRAVLTWAALRFVVNIVLAMAAALFAAEKLDEFTALTSAGSNAEPAAVGRAFLELAPFFLIAIPLNLILQAMIYAAAYRAFLRPGERRWGYLQFGGDELRLIAVTILWILIFAFLVFLATFVLIILVVVADQIGGALAGGLAVFAVLGFIGVVVWSAVRMSLAWAVSFDQKRISLFSTWRLTKGHFWSVLGAYLLAAVLTIVVSLAAMAVFMAVAAAIAVASGAGLAAIGQVFQPDATSLAAYFTPAMIAYLAFEAIISAASYALMLGPTAEAYKVFGSGRHLEAVEQGLA